MKLRRIIAVLVLICMLFTQQSTVVFAEVLAETIKENVKAECPETGVFGENDGFSWTFDSSTKTMTITGSDLITITSYIPTDGTYDIKKVIFKNCGFSEGSNLSYMFYLADMEEVAFEDCDLSKVVDMQFMFSKCPNLISVDMSDLDLSSVTNMEYMFEDSSKLVSVDFSNVNASNVTSMRGAFRLCKNLTSINLTGIDTSKVTDMSSMFTTCTSLTSFTFDDLDTASVTTTRNMFNECTKLTEIDITNLSTSNITDMSYMFYRTGFQTFDLSNMDLNGKNLTGLFYESRITEIDMSNADVSDSTLTDMFKCAIEKINMSNVKAVNADADNLFAGRSNLAEVTLTNANFSGAKMSGFFSNCTSLTHIDLSNIDTSNVTDMSHFFDYCYWLESVDLSGLDTESVTSFSAFFENCNHLASVDLSAIDTSSATDLSDMFYKCEALLSIDVSGFDTSNVTNMSGMFNTCTSVTSIDLTGMDTSNVTDMSKLFANCDALKSVDVTHFDTSNVTNMSEMFAYGVFDNIDVSHFNTENVTDMSHMFAFCDFESIDVSGFDVSNVQNMSGLFYVCNIKSIDVSKWDTSNVTDMNRMFFQNFNLESIDVCNWDTSKVTTMEYLFYECKNLKTVDVSKWNTSNVTNMAGMFEKCNSLTTVDVSKWNTSNVKKMAKIFSNCSSLTNIDVSGFDTSNNTHFNAMFENCSSLKEIDVSNFNTSKGEAFNGMFYGCSELSDIDVSNFDTAKATNMNHMFYGCTNLTELDLSNFNTAKVVYFNGMFKSCINLKKLDISSFDLNATTIEDFVLECNSLESISTPKVINSSISISLPHEFYYDAENTTNVINSSVSGKVLFVSKPGEIIVVPKEKFVIKVVDSSNSPLVNALVVYDGISKYTDEKGEVQFDKSDKEKPIYSVSLEGYYTCTNDNEFYKPDNEFYETITLYKVNEGNITLEYAYMSEPARRPVDVVKGPYMINFNNKEITYTLNCKAYDTSKIVSYELWQGDAMIAKSLTGVFTFTMDSGFEVDKRCYVKAINQDGSSVNTDLNILFYEKKQTGEFEFGGSSIKFTVPENIALIGGDTIEVSTPEIPLYYFNSPDVERIGINVNIPDEDENGNKKDEETKTNEWEKVKALIDASKKAYKDDSKDKKAIEELKKMVETDSMVIAKADASVTVGGWLEGNYKDNTLTGEIFIIVEVESPKFGKNFILYVVPVTLQFQFVGEGKVEAKLSYDADVNQFTSDLSLTLALGVNLYAGVGAANIASAGVKGSAKIETVIGLADVNPGLRSFVFEPSFGVYAEIGKFEYEYTCKSWPITLYPVEKQSSLNDNSYRSMYDASAYKVTSLDYMANESDWNGYGIYDITSEVRTEFSSLLEDTYSNAKPMMVGNADAVYATFLRADEATGDVYAVVTKGVMGVWNDPVSVDADVLTDEVQQIDGSPQLFLDDDGNLWMTYTRTLEGDNTTLLGYAKNQRIVVGKVDKTTLEFTEMKEFSSAGFANTPQLTVVNGVPTLSWIEATVTDDNSVLTAKANKIYKSTYANGAWSDAVEVSSVNYYIHDIAIGNEGYALIIDTDGDMETYEDRALKIYNWSAAETASVDGVIGNVSYGCLPGQNTKTFIWNGENALCSTTSSVAAPAITAEYAVAGDKIYYSANTGESTNLVVVSKNGDGTFGAPVQLTDSSRYFENISVVEVGNNDVVLGMHTDATITETDIVTEKNLVWTIVQPVNDVCIDGVSVDKSVVTAGSNVPVSVWVKNNGLNAVEEVAIKVNGSVVSTQTVSLKPGEEKEITLNISCPSALTEYSLQVYDTSVGISADYTPDDNSATAKIGHSDVSVNAELMFVGEHRIVTATVENKGVAPVSGTLVISDENGSEIAKQEFSSLTAGSAVLLDQELHGFISDETVVVSILTENEEIYTHNNSTTVFVPEYEDAPEEEEVTVTYTVKFDGNGAISGSMDSITCEYDQSYTLPANKFVREGYRFKGWNMNADGTGNAYIDKSEIKNLTAVNGSAVTLYAQWEKVEVNVPDGWNQAEDGNWYYYKDNEVDTSANGILPKGSEYWYAVKGKADFTVTTVARYQNQWWYVNKGKVDFTYTGLASNSSGTWYMKNGVLDTSVSGLIKIENKWWYLKGGKVDKAYNGLVKNAGKWWYIKDGTINFTYKGLVKNAGKWWYIANGTINFQFVGIVKNAGQYWYISNGQINFTYKGLVKNAGNWWFVQNGKIDLSYDGVATNSAGTWYIENGKLDATKNGIYARGGNYYYFKGGKVNTAVNGIVKNAGQYWYFEKGMINFKFVGIVDNAGSKWYVRNGKIDFSFSGTVTYNGYTYTIVKGRVEHIRR